MSAAAWIAIVLQTLVILGGILMSWIRTDRRITRLETKMESIETKTDGLKNDHSGLGRQVQGISRSVARLEGAHFGPETPKVQSKQ